MIIEVTEKHISYGRKQDNRYCPLALAVNDKLPKDYYAVITYRYVYVYPTNLAREVTWDGILHSCRQWIGRFDHNQPVEPFKFELKLEPVLEKINESIHL